MEEQQNQEIDIQSGDELGQKINSQVEEGSENKKLVSKTRKIWIIVGAILVLIVGLCLFLFFTKTKVYNIYSSNNINTNQVDFRECKKNDSCCVKSRELTSKNNYSLISDDEACPNGYKKNMLKCPTSLAWCEPIQKNSTSGGEFMLYSKKATWEPCPMSNPGDCGENIVIYNTGKAIFNSEEGNIDKSEIALLENAIIDSGVRQKECDFSPVVDYWAEYYIHPKTITYPGCEDELKIIDKVVDEIMNKQDNDNKDINLQTFKNEEYGFEFKYPSDFIPREAYGQIFSVEKDEAGVNNYISVQIRNGYQVDGDIIFKNRKANKYFFQEGAGYSGVFQLQLGGDALEIVYDMIGGENKEKYVENELDKIISSINFSGK